MEETLLEVSSAASCQERLALFLSFLCWRGRFCGNVRAFVVARAQRNVSETEFHPSAVRLRAGSGGHAQHAARGTHGERDVRQCSRRGAAAVGRRAQSRAAGPFGSSAAASQLRSQLGHPTAALRPAQAFSKRQNRYAVFTYAYGLITDLRAMGGIR